MQRIAPCICRPRIANYTDFFAGIHHAVNASRMFGMELTPNYKHVPIAYHGRASSVIPSGTTVTRPCGQYVVEIGKPPSFGACQALDYEFRVRCLDRPGQRAWKSGAYFSRGGAYLWLLPA